VLSKALALSSFVVLGNLSNSSRVFTSCDYNTKKYNAGQNYKFIAIFRFIYLPVLRPLLFAIAPDKQKRRPMN